MVRMVRSGWGLRILPQTKWAAPTSFIVAQAAFLTSMVAVETRLVCLFYDTIRFRRCKKSKG